MRAYESAVFALVAFTLGALPVGAQDVKTLEVTPYVALGSAAASPVGVWLTFPVASTLSFETDVAYRRGEGRIHALSTSASLVWFLPRLGESTPYARWFQSFGPHGSEQFRVARGLSFDVGKR